MGTLGMFENRVMSIFLSTRAKVKGRWNKLHDDILIICTVTRSRNISCVGHVAHMREIKKLHTKFQPENLNQILGKTYV
jgi:hypothetical protein